MRKQPEQSRMKMNQAGPKDIRVRSHHLLCDANHCTSILKRFNSLFFQLHVFLCGKYRNKNFTNRVSEEEIIISDQYLTL